MSDKTFRPWEPDQQMLFPPSVRDFVPEGHLAHFVRDMVRQDLNPSAIYARYTECRGQPPYHPALMVSLLLYSYSRGIYSSRRIERACEVIVCHTVTAKQNDHDELVPMMVQTEQNTGSRPKETSADTGYCSEENIKALEDRGIRGEISQDSAAQWHREPLKRLLAAKSLVLGRVHHHQPRSGCLTWQTVGRTG